MDSDALTKYYSSSQARERNEAIKKRRKREEEKETERRDKRENKSGLNNQIQAHREAFKSMSLKDNNR